MKENKYTPHIYFVLFDRENFELYKNYIEKVS